MLDDLPGDGLSFLLDGQTVVLEDYLEVRPERASELAAALRGGRLEAGPWFVLADELIPGGEGLVRNLLAGRRTLRALRAESPPVLYCPDSFGHPAALPDLARGFDKSVIILWRGFGGSLVPPGDTFWWSAPSGARVLLHHLTRSGYELGANLPADAAEARDRWRRIRAEIGTRSKAGLVILLNGADHHARQRALPKAVRALRQAAEPDVVVPSTLSRFARDLTQRVEGQIPAGLSGELRDSYGYTWTLQGTLASRTPQKRRYALVERMLLRDVEPWAALAAFHGAASRKHLSTAAWRQLLLCQPHDTLCGCSIDAVARAMDSRLESAAVQGAGLREDAILDLLRHDRDVARARPDQWRAALIVRNPVARKRSGVAIVEIAARIADISVGPGSSHVALPPIGTPLALPLDWKIGGQGQLLDASLGLERTEAPRSYPDSDAVAKLLAAIWVSDVPPYGLSATPISAIASSHPPDSVTVKGRSMTNGRLTLRWDATGRVALTDVASRRTIRGLIEWESREDLGDLYTPSIRRRKLLPRIVSTKLVHRGPLRGVVEQRWRFASKRERVDVTLQLILDAAAPWLRLLVLGDNDAMNHRLRILVRNDVRASITVADAAFGIVERAPIRVAARDARMEKPVPTAPLHRYVSLFNETRGATLYSDGLAEYESLEERIAVTLIRCVGELSRSDLPERPGHAGWPSPTPEAQCPGPFEAELALMLHGPRSPDTTDEIERAAEDILFPITGETLRSALQVPPPIQGLALEGRGLAFSSAKESENGEMLVLRCVNLHDEERSGSWRLGARAINEAHLARLDETPVLRLRIENDSVPFRAPGRAVVTILVR